MEPITRSVMPTVVAARPLCGLGESTSPVQSLGSGTMSDHLQTEPFDTFPAEPFNALAPVDISRHTGMPPWLARHFLPGDYEITGWRGPRFNPPRNLYVTPPLWLSHPFSSPSALLFVRLS